MSIMDLFKANPNPPAAGSTPTPAKKSVTPAPGEPGNIPEPVDPPAAGQGVVPSSATSDSPLAAYEGLWESNPADPNSSDPDTANQSLQVKDVQAAVSKANFAQSIPPEMLQAISEGGEAAQQAFASAINKVAQDVMVQATVVGNKLTEKAVAAALENQTKQIPNLLRDQAATAHLQDSSPLLKNPAIAPVAEATKAQLLAKYPNATPAEITEMTVDYIRAVGQFMNPPAESESKETDWSKFLEA